MVGGYICNICNIYYNIIYPNLSTKPDLPGRVVSGELQHRLVEDRVGVDVDVLGDRQLDGGADPHTLRQS